jgi:soluble lytic murein transglycosylase-like protein
LYYNVNLPEYVQDVIFAECEKYAINPAIVIAMIERESQFIPDIVGDNGNSFGLMQIQPYWHSQRMAKLNCMDLFNPVHNVTVGIDILGELYIRYNDIGLALTAYNSGSANNGYSGYAIAVMARANEVR